MEQLKLKSWKLVLEKFKSYTGLLKEKGKKNYSTQQEYCYTYELSDENMLAIITKKDI